MIYNLNKKVFEVTQFDRVKIFPNLNVDHLRHSEQNFKTQYFLSILYKIL